MFAKKREKWREFGQNVRAHVRPTRLKTYRLGTEEEEENALHPNQDFVDYSFGFYEDFRYTYDSLNLNYIG